MIKPLAKNDLFLLKSARLKLRDWLARVLLIHEFLKRASQCGNRSSSDNCVCLFSCKNQIYNNLSCFAFPFN